MSSVNLITKRHGFIKDPHISLSSVSNDFSSEVVISEVRSSSQLSKLYKSNTSKSRHSKEYNRMLTTRDLQNYLTLRLKLRNELLENHPIHNSFQEFKKILNRLSIFFSSIMLMIINTWAFELLTLAVIIMNTIVLAFDDNFGDHSGNIELFFIYFYSIECIMKIIGFGIIYGRSAYFRDFLNIIDFVIVVTSWVELNANSGIKLSALRTFRIIRPLKSISSVKGLRSIIIALANSMQPLMSALILISFFVLVFAIIGLQLWLGFFGQRCMQIDTGVFSDRVCGAEECFTGFSCVRGLSNPNYGTSNFDNIFSSLINVFMCITLEGWTTIMNYATDSYSFYSFLYFVLLELIGANIIVNLTLAIITSSFCGSITDENSSNSSVSIQVKEKFYLKLRNIQNLHSMNSNKSEVYAVYEDEEKIQRPSRRPGISRTVQEQNSFCNLMEDNLDNTIFEDSGIRKVLSSNSKVLKQKHEAIKGIEYTFDCGQEFKQKSASHTLADEVSLVTSSNSFFIGKFMKTLSVRKDTIDLILNNDIKLTELVIEVDPNYTYKSSSQDDILFSNTIQDIKQDPILYSLSTISSFLKFRSENLEILKSHYNEHQRTLQLFRYLSITSPKKHVFSILSFSTQKLIRSLNSSFQPYEVNIYQEINPESQISYPQSIFQFPHLHDSMFYKFQDLISKLMKTKSVAYTSTLIIVLNTATLSIDHYGISNYLNGVLFTVNSIFTYLFVIETSLRLIGSGLTEYFRDKMNYFDSIVVILSMIEFFVASGTSFSAFRVVRVFRIIRVLKIARIFRYLTSISTILRTLSNSISRFAYLILFLSILLVVFSLLGMQIFKSNFNFPEGLPRANFENFYSAVLTMFQVLSTENWNEVLTSSIRYHPASCIFLVVWIVVGNFVFMNLVLAILIRGFDESEEEEKDSEIFKTQQNKLLTVFQRDHSTVYDSRASMFVSWNTFKAINEYSPKSLFLFEQQNKFRILSLRIVSNKKFEHAIMLLIIVSSLKLVWDTYIMKENNTISFHISYYFDFCITLVFAVEFLLKSISFGFGFSEFSYIYDHWNKLDLLIVIVSIVDISTNSFDVPAIKSLRLLRTLRPLKLIKHNNSMKIVVTALLDSLAAIFNVLIVIIIFWLVFAIIGVDLFAGKLHCCSNSSFPSRSECEKNGFNWVNSRFNFDNIGEAMITLFVVISQESWPTRMNEGIDAKGIDMCPEKNFNPLASIYYITYLVLGNFFLINLFTAVVFEKFNNAKRKTVSPAYAFLNNNQILWMEMQKLIIESSPTIEIFKAPTSWLRKWSYWMSKSKYFEVFVMAIIILNIVVMCLPYYEASETYMKNLDYINQACTYFFIFEAAVKFVAYGKHYFKSRWNQLDVLVVLFSVLEILLSNFLSHELKLIKQIPQIVRIFRVLRIARLTRILKMFIYIQNLVFLLAHSLGAILNVLSLLLLVMFIFAITGVFLFYSVDKGQVINEFYNFSNFSFAMFIIWRMSTGEDYPSIMLDCAEWLGSKFAVLYFIVFIITIDFIVLELFVSVILQNYEDFSTNPNSVFKVFHFYYKKFMRVWSKYSSNELGKRMHDSHLSQFISEISVEFDLNEMNSKASVILFKSLNLEKDKKGFLYFNSVLYYLMKKKLSQKALPEQHQVVNRFMRKVEEKTIITLKKIRKKTVSELDEIKKEYEQKKNKFFSIILLKNIFASLKRYSKRNKSCVSVTPLYTEIEFPGFNSLN